MNSIHDLLKRLVDWFLGKSQPKLETLELETITGDGLTLIRYKRKTRRSYRTWKAIYTSLDYDIIFGWDTLAYLPDVPSIKKRNRLSTHTVSIYRQGFHARYNAVRRCHEPDIQVLLSEEVCLESLNMSLVAQQWRAKTSRTPTPILTSDDVVDRMIDEVSLYAIRHPPAEIDPLKIEWREVVQQTVRLFLGNNKHEVFPD